MNQNNTTNDIKPVSAKRIILEAYTKLLESYSDDFSLFSITAVFNAGGIKPNKARWLDEYNQKVLWKIKKQTSHSGLNRILIDDFVCYEFEESSLYQSVKDRRKPHHVHGVIPIPKLIAHKIWDAENNKITTRLQKDFDSIETVSSVLMEPIQVGKLMNWSVYMFKGKEFNLDRFC